MGPSPPGHKQGNPHFCTSFIHPVVPPHHCSQGTRGIPLVSHTLDLLTHPHGQSLDNIRSSLFKDSFLLSATLASFQIKREESVWCESLNIWGCLRHILSRLPQVSTPYGHVLWRRPCSLWDPCTHAHRPWASPLGPEWAEDLQSKAPSEIPVLNPCACQGCFSPLGRYASLWRLFAAKPSTCAVRHSLPPDLVSHCLIIIQITPTGTSKSGQIPYTDESKVSRKTENTVSKRSSFKKFIKSLLKKKEQTNL